MPKSKFIYAFDPKIKRRVAFVVENGYAISLVTKTRFKYNPKKRK
jgi:hypothetical protein